jgi:hypothetical protein
MANSLDIDRLVAISAARTVTGSIYDVRPPMTPKRVKETGRQFGQKIGGKEARAIAALLKGA